MEKRGVDWKTKGMNRDMSVSAFSNEFSFENRNMRLSATDGNTLMSWVNEKGTSKLSLSIDVAPWEGLSSDIIYGAPIGTAVINDQLVLFTTASDADYIYVFWYEDVSSEDDEQEDTDGIISYDSLRGKLLYRGHLNFDTDHPIETLVSFEAKHIQKVYWTDGYNQPRVINIASDAKKQALWNHQGFLVEGIDTFFDFVPALSLQEEVEVKQSSGGGLFESGVIQYCFTYVNKYGQESNVAWVSPLYYLSHSDRGGQPDETVTTSFTLSITGQDRNFDYLRLYAIQRMSLNGDAKVRLLEDISTDGNYKKRVGHLYVNAIRYIDTGTTGSTVDPYQLLYAGGREITALTMADKDGTLFLGNLTEKHVLVNDIQDYYTSIQNEIEISFDNSLESKSLSLKPRTGYYPYSHTLGNSHRILTTLKSGEWYRFGFQLQKNTGEWTEPIFLKDQQVDIFPKTSVYTSQVGLVSAWCDLDFNALAEYLQEKGSTEDFDYVKARPVIVYPSIAERSVLCQGVLNPTVFNAISRISHSPDVQSSWYFRPYMVNEKEDTSGYADRSTTTRWKSGSPYQDQDVFKDYLEDVYILWGTFTDEEDITNTLASGGLRIKASYASGGGYGNTKTRMPFYGAIKMNVSDRNTDYLFIIKKEDLSYHPFKKYKFTDGNIGNIEDYLDLKTYYTSDSTVELYSDIRTDLMQHLLYYLQTRDGDDYQEYLFNFKVPDGVVTGNNQYAQVQFKSVSPLSNSGGIMNYTHYDDIVRHSDYIAQTAFPRSGEIMGYESVYSDAFSARSIDIPSSNTQFLIDQSIVTLNSPDLDFDPELQGFPTDGLKLRVIGAIPLTSSASAHHIAKSSNMLEADYNSKDSSTASEHLLGIGELQTNMFHANEDTASLAGRHLLSEFLWNDVWFKQDGDTITTNKDLLNYLIYPWHRSGSLIGDTRSEEEAASLLKTKVESNLLFSYNTEYLDAPVAFSHIDVQTFLKENAEILNVRIGQQLDYTERLTHYKSSEINYYPNVDMALYNKKAYLLTNTAFTDASTKNPVSHVISMKYKSNSHFVIGLQSDDTGNVRGRIPILPYGRNGNLEYGRYYPKNKDASHYEGQTFWGDIVRFTQEGVDVSGLFKTEELHVPHNWLWLGELYRDDIQNRFGGDTRNAIRSNTWIVAGETVNIVDGEATHLDWTDGDTYYQRYDCLKTYPYTEEDTNQLVEILSFMCETHVNIDGRYDRNRGQIDNTMMSPLKNFNLINSTYSQKPNFFTGKNSNADDLKELIYPNYIWYSQTKQEGAQTDAWTRVSLASVLSLDGDKGSITSLQRFNDQLIAFQDTGISQILYNENVQISSTQGIPIEIANSGKVQGKRYLSNHVGCSNKWSIASTPSSLYFMDSHTHNIYRFGGQLENLSAAKGFASWCKSHIHPSSQWTPKSFGDYVSYYDSQNQEVLFVGSDEALAYSEKMDAFTSFYDYGHAPYFNNLIGSGVWVKDAVHDGAVVSEIWLHHGGAYGSFFGKNKGYSMTFVGNPEPQTDKLFTNLEFRASVTGEGYITSKGVYHAYLPFDTLEVWNEYQHGIATLQMKNGHASMVHHAEDINTSSPLKRKFRMWRCDIPRDNALVDSSGREIDSERGISRYGRHPNSRMRNPWLYLKLSKEAHTELQPKAEVHDVTMWYFR